MKEDKSEDGVRNKSVRHIRPLVLTHKNKRTNCGIVIILHTTAKMSQSYYGMSSLSTTSVDEMVFI